MGEEGEQAACGVKTKTNHCMQINIQDYFPFFVIPAVNALNHGGFLREKLKRGREKPAPITLCLGPRFSRNMPWAKIFKKYALGTSSLVRSIIFLVVLLSLRL